MKTNFKRMLVAILTVCGALSVYAEDLTPTVTRLSNPTLGEAQLDGYIAGGMHGNDYTQSMTVLGDYVLIATSANVGYAFTRRYNPNWNFWYIAGELYNGRFPFYDPEDTEKYDGARIIAYDTRNGSFSVLYEGENGVGYRCAATTPDGGVAYFAAYSADSRVKPYILKITKSSNLRPEKCEKYFETNDCVALRGFCEYEGRLYFAGADEREDATNLFGDKKPVKLAVLAMHSTTSLRVADYKDFGDLAYDETLKVWNDSPIFDIASYGGYIYVSIPSSTGFVIFRGHPAATGESKNVYGWHWEEVAGLTNGVNNPALSETAGGEPGNVNMLSGTFFEFNDRLYVTNSNHSIMGELSVFVNGIKKLTEQPFNAINYLNYMYTLLQNPQKIWCLDNLTGKFELQPIFTQNMLSTLNARFGEYDGQLYVATLDAGYAYSWLSQIAIDDFIRMTPSEIIAKLTILDELIQSLTRRKAQDPVAQQLMEQLEKLQAYLLQFLKSNVDNTTDVANVADVISLEDIVKLIKMISAKDATATTPAGIPVADCIAELLKVLSGTTGTSATTPAGKCAIIDILKALGLAGITGIPEITNIEDIANLPLSEWKEFLDTIIVRILQDKLGIEFDPTTVPDILDITSLTEYKDLLDDILKLIQERLGDITIGEGTTAEMIYYALLNGIKENIHALLSGLETSALSNYLFIFERMRTNKMGFDLMRTSDGYNFEYITRDGFGDKFNFGCPSFATTKDGLYIGTSNPFFGGQLWLLANPKSSSPIKYNGTTEDDADALQSITSSEAQSDYYTLDGRRVSAKSVKSGLYIHNGKKVLVK